MAPLLFILISIALLGGFFALTTWEARRGARAFAAYRSLLDREVEHALFIVQHVDWDALLREHASALAVRVGHEVAHYVLQTVRSLERLLTRTVRELRTRLAEEPGAPRGSTRPFVQALSGFKEELRAARPVIPEA